MQNSKRTEHHRLTQQARTHLPTFALISKHDETEYPTNKNNKPNSKGIACANTKSKKCKREREPKAERANRATARTGTYRWCRRTEEGWKLCRRNGPKDRFSLAPRSQEKATSQQRTEREKEGGRKEEERGYDQDRNLTNARRPRFYRGGELTPVPLVARPVSGSGRGDPT